MSCAYQPCTTVHIRQSRILTVDLVSDPVTQLSTSS